MGGLGDGAGKREVSGGGRGAGEKKVRQKLVGSFPKTSSFEQMISAHDTARLCMLPS